MNSIFDGPELDDLRADRFARYRRAVARDDLLGRGFIIYGAGVEGRLLLSCLEGAGLSPLCLVDRDPRLHGETIGEARVMPPAELANHGDCVVVIASCRVRSITKDNPFLSGRPGVVVWSALSGICPILPELPESIDEFFENEGVARAYSILADETSRTIFRDFIKFHVSFDEALFSDYEPGCYFPAGSPLDHRRFIDAGASDGDTLRCWLAHGYPRSAQDRYYAFEPCRAEFSRLESFVAGLPREVRGSVELHDCGLGERDGILCLRDAGKSSWIGDRAAYGEDGGDGGDRGDDVSVMRLDDVLAGAWPSLIKADVEGTELDLLAGAEGTIRRCAPDLAISVYHRYSDLWRIPLWIKGVDGRYGIFLRHHSRAYDDVVCYALGQR
ncbi:MAG: FkbM family methyltransferase [Deltaproteobacteria bacterium]|nr:FkbM family methyltransferase [Deltaproteobacteria bacterium]